MRMFLILGVLNAMMITLSHSLPPPSSSSIANAITAADNDIIYDYGMSIDAGSTGTRIYLYRWQAPNSNGGRSFIQPQTRPSWTFKLNQGISQFASDPEKVGPFLQPLIDFCVDRLSEESVPALRFKSFPFYLKATAGMRVLRYSQRDSIMSSIKSYLHDHSPFWFEDSMARVISGQEEGVYAWLTVNYMHGTLFKGAKSIGLLDMGGASTQITFRPVHDIIAEFFPLRLNTKNVRLYSHSFLLFGVKEARRRLRVAVVQQTLDSKLPVDSRGIARQIRRNELLSPAPQAPLPFSHERLNNDAPYYHPCYARGYQWTESLTGEGEEAAPTQFIGTGNYSACIDLAIGLLPMDNECYTHSCAFGGVYLPRILNNSFVAISYYTETVIDQLRLSSNPSLSQIEDKTREICEYTHHQLQSSYPDVADPTFFCANAVWAFTVLRYGYRFHPNSQQITYLPDPGAMGAMLYEANLLESRSSSNDSYDNNMFAQPLMEWKNALLGTSYWTLLIPSLLLITTLISSCYACQLRHRLNKLGYHWPQAQREQDLE